MDLDSWPYPNKPLVPLAETVHERKSVEIFRGCTRGCRFCQAGMITRPVRERSITTIGEMVEQGWRRPASRRSACSRCPAPTTPRSARSPRAWPTATRAPTPACRCPSTRVDAFNITLADELSRNGRRSGLTFAPEGGSERMRKVINKMVTEEDLIRTVADRLLQRLAAGEAVLHVRAADRDRRGRAGDRRPGPQGHPGRAGGSRAPRHPLHGLHRRVRAQAAHAVPVGGAVRRTRWWTRGCVQLGAALRADRTYGRAIGFRYHDGKPRSSRACCPAATAGSARSSGRRGADGAALRRLERVLLLSTAGWRCAGQGAGRPSRSTWTGTPPASGTATRCCPGTTSTPASTRTGSGRTGRTRSATSAEVEDCRWTPCFDCGVCPSMGTEIQTGPTGRAAAGRHQAAPGAERELTRQRADRPSPPARRPRRRCSICWSATPSAAGCGSPAIATWAARSNGPSARPGSRWRTRPASARTPKISYASGTPTGVASEAEYLTLALTAAADPARLRSVLDRALPDGIDVIEVVEDSGGSLNGRLTVSEWLVKLPGIAPDAAEAAAREFLAAPEVMWNG